MVVTSIQTLPGRAPGLDDLAYGRGAEECRDDDGRSRDRVLCRAGRRGALRDELGVGAGRTVQTLTSWPADSRWPARMRPIRPSPRNATRSRLSVMCALLHLVTGLFYPFPAAARQRENATNVLAVHISVTGKN